MNDRLELILDHDFFPQPEIASVDTKMDKDNIIRVKEEIINLIESEIARIMKDGAFYELVLS